VSTAISRQKLSPPQISKAWGVSIGKVLGWIRSGELHAINAARKAGGKPRYLVDVDDLEAFERARAAVPDAKPAHTRRTSAGSSRVTEYF
jgi:hypothetical protein